MLPQNPWSHWHARRLSARLSGVTWLYSVARENGTSIFSKCCCRHSRGDSSCVGTELRAESIVSLDVFLPPGCEARRGEPLTARQREVLQLLAEGRSMKEVADLLHVTARTVAFHKYTIMEHLGLQDKHTSSCNIPSSMACLKTEKIVFPDT